MTREHLKKGILIISIPHPDSGILRTSQYQMSLWVPPEPLIITRENSDIFASHHETNINGAFEQV